MELRMMSRSIRVTGQENVYEAQVRWPEIELSGASLADDPSSAACSAARAKFGLTLSWDGLLSHCLTLI